MSPAIPDSSSRILNYTFLYWFRDSKRPAVARESIAHGGSDCV